MTPTNMMLDLANVNDMLMQPNVMMDQALVISIDLMRESANVNVNDALRATNVMMDQALVISTDLMWESANVNDVPLLTKAVTETVAWIANKNRSKS